MEALLLEISWVKAISAISLIVGVANTIFVGLAMGGILDISSRMEKGK